MEEVAPCLEVQEPDGGKYIIKLKDFIRSDGSKRCITIGRGNENDIVLPDPDKKISRHHCALEYHMGHWWVADEVSANGTFVQRSNGETVIDVRFDGKVSLVDGDVIQILGRLIESDEYLFWHLTFLDSGQTQPVQAFQFVPELQYSLGKEKLSRVTVRGREEFQFSPQERRLVHYMAQQNHNNQDEPLVCGYEQLLKAIWQEPFGHTNTDVTRLIWGIRNKIEADSGEPRFLQTVKGRGYILYTKILP